MAWRPATPSSTAAIRITGMTSAARAFWPRAVSATLMPEPAAMALAENPDLSSFTGSVLDSGEGRWTIAAALEEAVPADVLSASLYTRFRSRRDHTFAEKVLSAMRYKFGGHLERPAGG